MNEWIELNIPYESFEMRQRFHEECLKYSHYSIDEYNDIKKKIKKEICKDFVNSEYNRPGVLIETESGEKYLIGHINTESGTCGCCGGISEMIKRCCLIWKESADI